MPSCKARAASPRRAIGMASSVVMRLEGEPGMLRSEAETRPPEIEPTYMPTKSAIASSGFQPKVSGRLSAMSMPPFRPGIAPAITPSTVPRTMRKRG